MKNSNKLQILYSQAVEINKRKGHENEEYTNKMKEIRKELLSSITSIK